MDEFDKIKGKLLGWESHGIKEIPKRVLLICRVPTLGPDAWLHTIYCPLNDKGIDQLVKSLKGEGVPITIPEPYLGFLRCSNGLNLFVDALALWGLRTSWKRTGDDIWQPYHLPQHYKECLIDFHKHIKTPIRRFYFGSYEWDGSRLFMDTGDNSVHRVGPDSPEVKNSWPDFWIFLDDEVTRLSKLYDDNGNPLDNETPTIP